MSDENMEAFWVGALAMGLALAHKQIEKGNYGAAARVMDNTLQRYVKSTCCGSKFRRRLERHWKAVHEYDEYGNVVQRGLPGGDSSSGVGQGELEHGHVVGASS